MRGCGPVELDLVDGAYYVLDGHYRISVARTLGNDTITATVRRLLTDRIEPGGPT